MPSVSHPKAISRDPRTWTPDEQRFRELLLYVSQKCANDPRFGAVKLNKILFFSDFLFYGEHGKPITCFEYQKLENGPAPRDLKRIRTQMQAEGILGVQVVPLKSGHTQHRTVNLRSPNLKVFKADQIAIVDQVIDALATADAETASELSHRMIGWIAARDNETIPYETAFVSNQPLTDVDRTRGWRFAKGQNLVS